MKISERDLTVLDRDADPEFYFKNLPDEKLIEIVEDLNDYDDASSALTEISIRNKKNAAADYCFKILKENLGDEFLQATAFNLLFNSDIKKAVEIIETRKSDASVSLLGEIMNNLASNSLQPLAASLSQELLKSIVDRFSEFSSKDQEHIFEEYQYFTENYKI